MIHFFFVAVLLLFIFSSTSYFVFYFGPKKDAAGLTKLSASVEDVFASGDLSQAAETLATMRHCLSAVGEVYCIISKFYPNLILI